MSDTPQTDANIDTHLWFVRANFARKLERERDEARTCAEKLAEALRLEAAAEDSGFRRVGTTSALAEFDRLKEGGK